MNRLLFLCLFSSAASAGTTLTWERSKGSEKPTTLVMKCEGGNARFEGSAAAGRTVIWDAAKKTLAVLKPAEKTYSQLTEAQLLELRERMKAMAEQMRGRLDSLPPAQRAQLEAMLGAAEETAEWKFTATGKKSRVGKWECELYDGERGAVKSQSCMVPWPSAPAKKDELECVKSVSSLFQALSRGLARDSDTAPEDLTKFPGLPVQTTRSMADGQQLVSTLKSAEKGKIPPDAFLVPKDYTLTKTEGLGGTHE